MNIPMLKFRRGDKMSRKYYVILKELRIDHDLTQEQVAKILDTRQEYYSKYETGKRRLPIEHLKKLCEYYQVSADYILGLPNNLAWPRTPNKGIVKIHQRDGNTNNIIF